jgi:hypothetical protein
VYDTLDNNISGVSQQQGGDTSLTFSSQYGTISVSTLPVIYGSGNLPSAPQSNFAEPTQNNFSNPTPLVAETNTYQTEPTEPKMNINQNESANSIIGLIEKLSGLRDAGALTDDEFNAKKAELLSRL